MNWMLYFVRVGIIVGLNLGALVPWLFISPLRSLRTCRPLFVAGLLFTVDIALLLTPHFGPFARLHQNWQGQMLSVAWSVGWVWSTKLPTFKEAGVVLPVQPRALAAALLVAAIFVWSTNALDWLLGNSSTGTAEHFFFELTLPGISEEFVYRGTLLALLNRTFPRPWRLFGARVGWGWVLSSLLFISLHFFRTNSSAHISLYLNAHDMGGIALAAFGLGWIRERTGSLWPGVLAHNVANLIG